MLWLSQKLDKGETQARPSDMTRNIGLDILKLICAFFIVYIHSPRYGVLGDVFYMISRIAVPIFFMITGFFYVDTVVRGKVFAQIKKIFFLFVISNLIYLLVEIILSIVPEMKLSALFSKLFNIQTITEFVIFNESPVGYHLWYLGSILYTLIIMAFAYTDKTKKVLWYTIPILLLTDLMFGEYSVLLWNKIFPGYVVRNFLCVGIPYFLLGTLLRENKQKIAEKTTCVFWLVCCAFFVVLTVAERYCLTTLGIASRRRHNISTTFLAVSVFLLFFLFFENRKENKLTNIISRISIKHAAWIYIVHPLFIIVCDKIADILNAGPIYKSVRFVIVYVCTILFLIFLDAVKRYIKGMYIKNMGEK